MDQNTAYQYKALNEDSYNSLAAFAVSTPATVTLHPGLLTIVITGDDANEVGKLSTERVLTSTSTRLSFMTRLSVL